MKIPPWSFRVLNLAVCLGWLVGPLAAAPVDAEKKENAFSFGLSPETPGAVQEGIERAYRSGAKKIVLPRGVYRIPRPENMPFHLRFADMKDFEIDATGVTFVFTGRDRRSILFDNCERVTLRGLTMVREVPPFSQGKIEAIADDRRSVDIRVDRGYPTDLDDKRYFTRIPVLTLYEKGTRKLKPLVPDLYIASIERLGDDLFRFHCRSAIDTRVPIALGDPVAWRKGPGGEIAVWSSGGMRIENVTIKGSCGIAFMELCGDGGNRYINCKITYGPKPAGATELPLLSSSEDGFHSASLRKGPVLERCQFEGMDDDAVNIHGTYGMLVETGEKSVIVDWRTPHSGARTPFPFAVPGDTLRFYNRRGALIDEASVVSVAPLKDYSERSLGPIDSRVFSKREGAVYFQINLDHTVKGEPCGMVANPGVTGSGFVIRNCTFRNNRGHGLFIRASDGLIENCTLEGIAMAGIVIGPEMTSWNESDYARNVTIRGNTVRNVGVATQCWNSGITVAAFEYGGFVPLPGGHRNIVISDNVLERNRGVNIAITSTIGAEISGNRFVKPMAEPAFRLEQAGISNDRALIWLRNTRDVVLKNNSVSRPGAFFNTLLDADSSVQGDGLGSAFTPITGSADQ